MRKAALKLCSILAALALSGCTQTLKETGKEPVLSAVDQGAMTASTAPSGFPRRPAAAIDSASTWQDGAGRLFTSAKALEQGDVLTVLISINDKAQLTNQSDRKRDGNKSIGLTASGDVNGASSAASANGSIKSSTDFSGSGGINRSESIRLSVAAVVEQVLPNGNMVIRGSQEVRVNAELRVLTIEGLARPSDINPDNTISYERIAEARISYGGRGRISEVQQPAYGQQLLDSVLPL
jgi:flagellar L-ring protein FlgH